jgi:toxin ParE1/3/4
MSSPSRVLSLTARARRDIRHILAYTERRWGPEQANIYEEELDAALELIRSSPEMSRPRPELFADCRSRTAGQHIAYFRIRTNQVVVHRILHHKQNPDGKVRRNQN